MPATAVTRAASAAAETLERLYRPGAAIGSAAAAGLALLLFQALFWAEHVSWPLKTGVAAVAAVSCASPASGLLVVAGLSPLGHVLATRVAGAYPARITEALALAFFAGHAVWSIRARFGRRAAPAVPAAALRLSAPAVLFGAAALASCLVHYHFVQVWQDRPWPFLQRLLEFLARGYHDGLGNYEPAAGDAGFRFVYATAFAVEGAALVLAAYVWTARDGSLAPRLVRMTVAGAVGAAALSFYALAAAALREADPWGALPGLLDRRWTLFTPKLNTAASLLVLAAPLAIGAASRATKWRRAGWTAAAAVLVAALWLNGTRVALLAAVLVLGGTIACCARYRVRWRAPGRPATVGLVVLVVGLAATSYHRLVVDGDRALESLRYRVQYTETALRMFASAPVFGVGIDQYYLRSEQFAPPELLSDDYYRRISAHNPFLQTAAELGVTGLAPFAWLIGAALWAAVTALRSRPPPDRLLFGMLAGLAAFLITTASAGHPLAIEVTAYPFWIVLGLAAGRAGRPADESPAPGPGAARRLRRCIVLGAVLLACSVPARVALQNRGVDFRQVAYGLHDLEDNGVDRYRWTTGRVTLFVAASARAVELPLRAPLVERTGPATVEILLDGRPARRIELAGTDWTRVRLELPPSARRYRTLDLTITPTWFPAALLPGSTDPRELGVMLGAPRSGSAAPFVSP